MEKDETIKEIKEIMEKLYELMDKDELQNFKNELKKIYFGFKIAKEIFESEKEKKEIYEN